MYLLHVLCVDNTKMKKMYDFYFTRIWKNEMKEF